MDLLLYGSLVLLGILVSRFLVMASWRIRQVKLLRADLRDQIEMAHYGEVDLLLRNPAKLYQNVSNLLIHLVVYERFRIPDSVRLVEPLRVCVRWRSGTTDGLEVRIYLDIETDVQYARACVRDLVGR